MVTVPGGDRRDADNVSLPTKGKWNLARRDVGTRSGIKGVLATTDCRLLILDKV
jgi:hypothetical protein